MIEMEQNFAANTFSVSEESGDDDNEDSRDVYEALQELYGQLLDELRVHISTKPTPETGEKIQLQQLQETLWKKKKLAADAWAKETVPLRFLWGQQN